MSRIMRAKAVVGLCLFGLWLAGANSPATADSIVCVEEDWKLVVRDPHKDTGSPQVTTQMKRATYVERVCMSLLNFNDLPSYRAGGVQTQVWKGKDNLSYATYAGEPLALSIPDETITWTQRLRLSNGQLLYGLSAASSQTWGDFSGMEIVSHGSYPDLSDYTPSYSVDNSGITFGANRVSGLEITAIRYTYSNGSVKTDSTRRVVYPRPSPP